MPVGVFGKLPARRDFVQSGIDPGLLRHLDPWMQSAVAQSREHLGKAWLDTYLLAPIWRFWLGPKIAGKTVIGALMPSVDGVGRYFPLCVAGCFETPVMPPEIDDHDTWFAEIEALMLNTLSDEGSYEALVEGIASLPEPAQDGGVCGSDRSTVRGAFEALRHTRLDDFYGPFSFWWVPAHKGSSGTPRALMRRGLPQPVEYVMMIALDDDVE